MRAFGSERSPCLPAWQEEPRTHVPLPLRLTRQVSKSRQAMRVNHRLKGVGRASVRGWPLLHPSALLRLTKERAGNKFPISNGLGNSPIVPLGEKLVEHNLHGLLESHGVLPARLVHLVKDAHLDLQALLRFGLRHVVPNGLERVKDHSATRPGQVREQAVLNRIVL